MTQAFNLAQLANNLNTSGQLDATDGLNGLVANANLASSGSASSSTYLRGDRTWSALPAFGKVLQVVSVFDNTQYTFSAGSQNQATFYDISGLQVTITPTATSSKILIIASVLAGQNSSGYNIYFRLQRNSTNIANGVPGSGGYRSDTTAYMGFRGVGDPTNVGSMSMTFLDSPSTTSATVYKVQACNSGGSGYPGYVNRPALSGSDWYQSGASNLMVLEIGA